MKRAAFAVVMVLALAGCGGDRNKRLNVAPPAPGIPATGADVQGIYRSIHQGLLQLRGNGSVNLITPDTPGTTSGTYSLRDGNLVVQTDKCGGVTGRYRVEVTGEQKAGKAILNITTIDDGCEHRLRHLTIDPWVYADS